MVIDSLNENSKDIFRKTVICIKLWAKANGIAENKMGYLGGISWAIMVAKIC